MKRLTLALLLIAIFLGVIAQPLLMSQDAANQQKQKAAQPAGRSSQDIQKDLQAAGNELRGSLSGPDVLLDPAQRETQGPKAIPVLKKMITLFDELAKAEPDEKDGLTEAKRDFQTMLVVFGDPETKAALEKEASARDPNSATAATGAQTALLLASWWKSNKDEAAQSKVLDQVQTLAKAQPESDVIIGTLMKMSQVGASNEKLSDRAADIIVNDLKGNHAKQAAEHITAERKLKQMAGKPIEIAGTKLDGTKFSTKDWQGKVILVDFWATWCGPCIAELPRVKETYKKHHEKGLEILGVSCDSEAQALKAFLDKNPDMPWPQLFDAQQNPKIDWHPLAKEYGINGIPTMFLIDKKGVLRTTEARENFEELIPKMLEEK
jgi:thiol-disulfide isomerase/thioredoxin